MAQPTRRPCSVAGSASASTSAKPPEKFFQLNNWAAHACFALSYSGSHDVARMRMHMRMHRCGGAVQSGRSYGYHMKQKE